MFFIPCSSILQSVVRMRWDRSRKDEKVEIRERRGQEKIRKIIYLIRN